MSFGQFSNPIAGGLFLVRPALRSPGYLIGTTGWTINKDGSAEFNSVTVRGSLLIGGTSPNARTVVGGTVPAELVAYYAAGVAGVTPTAPETVVALLEQDFDGAGNYTYRALVIDNSATRRTSLVYGAMVGATVNEAGRFMLNPGALISGARFQAFTENELTILAAAVATQTVLSGRVPGDAFDRWSLNPAGTQGWGDGTTLTDAYLTRVDIGQMEMANRLQMRGFNALTDNAFNVLQNGESNSRLFIHYDGQIRWSNGTASSDVGLFRRAVNELSTDGDLSLSAVGAGLLIKEGANCTLGRAVLAAGTVTVANTNVTATCEIFAFCQIPGGAPGTLRISARTAGVSFTITSSSATDTSTVAWLILYPA